MGGYFDLSLFATGIRTATPIALAAMGGIMCQRAGIFNIGLEGMMLAGAFGASAGMFWFNGNLLLGMLTAVAFSLILALIYAFAVIKLHANAIVASISINLFGLGLTSYLLRVLFHVSASLRPPKMPKIVPIQIPVIKDIPVLGELFSGQNYMVYLCIILMIITAIILYKTHIGLNVRSIGESPDIAEAAGIKVDRVKLFAILWSGFCCGLAGMYMSTISVEQFIENMVAGRGYTAFTAFVFGGADPLATWLVSLLLGVGEAIGVRFEMLATWISPYIVKTFPHVLALIALALSSVMRSARMSGKHVKKDKKNKTKGAAVQAES